VKSFILSRLIQFPLILAVIYLITFACVWLAPGDPFVTDRNTDPAIIEQRKEQLNARTWYEFLGNYPLMMLRGDFGKSLHNLAFPVTDLIKERLKVSLVLGFMALTIAIVCGMTIGTISAVRRNGFLDWAGMTITLIGISVPSFVVASGLLIVFVGWLGWFDIAQADSIGDFVLPAIALSLAPMAYIVRLQRVSMLDVLGADYVRTARAKGLTRLRVVIKHCMRNAFLPVFTYLGPAAAFTLTGSFVVETVFRLPGLGQQFVESILNRDATMVLAQTMIYSALLLTLNLLVDIGYCFVDPRIDVSAAKS
jgi:oligopeptide transport system permease protein